MIHRYSRPGWLVCANIREREHTVVVASGNPANFNLGLPINEAVEEHHWVAMAGGVMVTFVLPEGRHVARNRASV